ncbi:MAG: tetrahydromethanopterin S-methyltransferase subunit A [Candidatus Bathyarchaeota archaeon]
MKKEHHKQEIKNKILKVKPPSEYPPENGYFLRGNDYSPLVVVVMLNAPREEGKIPPEVEKLVRIAIETGAALAGTLQTANTGIEKVIANVVSNPNIRYLVLCGKEVEGHKTGEALKALMENGINEKRTIIGTNAPTAYLFNIPLEAIERFRKQISLIDLLNEIDPEIIKKAVWSCYQEKPTEFKNYTLYDIGAYPEPAICCKITWKIEKPETIEEWEIEDILKESK